MSVDWPLGVMQGRLVPKYKGRYQAHPVGYWQDEFEVAHSLGLDLIEFILDFEDASENPLLKDGGHQEIADVVERTGVAVRSICADYFMEAPLHNSDRDAASKSIDVLRRLIAGAPLLGVTDIVIPCVDQSRIADGDDEDRLVQAIGEVIADAEDCQVNIALEMDLSPNAFSALLSRLDSARVTVNYDIGNSASLGFDVEQEWEAYGARISDVHIKDRTLGGGPVMLGEGDADIPLVFDLMTRHAFQGPVIMQAYRDDEGVAVFRSQLAYVKDRIGLTTR